MRRMHLPHPARVARLTAALRVALRRGAALLALAPGPPPLGAQAGAAQPAARRAPTLPASSLAARGAGGAWRVWWRADRAPVRWTDSGDTRSPLAGAVRWHRVADGVERAELALAGRGEARRLRVELVRVDPAQTRFRLHARVDAAGTVRGWRAGDAPPAALVAFNAGQFDEAGPWGWLVHDGRERQAPGAGALAPAVVVDDAGRVRIVPADRLAEVRAGMHAEGRRVREAFQSYPALLDGDGLVPAPLQAPGRGVDLAHRDARLALGVLADGHVLVALTRCDALGTLPAPLARLRDALPLGLTVPETAALMGALGARQAVLLDGGISAQLRVRAATRDAAPRVWDGVRAVPLGLVVEGR